MAIEHDIEQEFSSLREPVSLGKDDFHAVVKAAQTKIDAGVANLLTRIPLPEAQAKRIILRCVERSLSDGIRG